MKHIFLGYTARNGEAARAVEKNLINRGYRDIRSMDSTETFSAGHHALDTILSHCRDASCAIIIMGRDEVKTIYDADNKEKKKYVHAPGENVILEAGAFLGAKGKPGVIILLEGGYKDTHVPSDLNGCTYSPHPGASVDVRRGGGAVFRV